MSIFNWSCCRYIEYLDYLPRVPTVESLSASGASLDLAAAGSACQIVPNSLILRTYCALSITWLVLRENYIIHILYAIVISNWRLFRQSSSIFAIEAVCREMAKAEKPQSSRHPSIATAQAHSNRL